MARNIFAHLTRRLRLRGCVGDIECPRTNSLSVTDPDARWTDQRQRVAIGNTKGRLGYFSSALYLRNTRSIYYAQFRDLCLALSRPNLQLLLFLSSPWTNGWSTICPLFGPGASLHQQTKVRLPFHSLSFISRLSVHSCGSTRYQAPLFPTGKATRIWKNCFVLPRLPVLIAPCISAATACQPPVF